MMLPYKIYNYKNYHISLIFEKKCSCNDEMKLLKIVISSIDNRIY